MKKKWLSLILAGVACCGLAFGGCGDEGNGSSQASSASNSSVTEGITEVEWDEMLKEDAFVNCTIKQTSIVYETKESITGENQLAILRFVNDKVAVYVEIEGAPLVDRVFTGAEGKEMTASYCDVAFALLDKYENFEYQAQEDMYKVTETVSVTITANGTPCNVIMEEGEVTISKEGRLTSFTCKMTQEIPDFQMVIYADMTWEFSNYGTTVIE